MNTDQTAADGANLGLQSSGLIRSHRFPSLQSVGKNDWRPRRALRGVRAFTLVEIILALAVVVLVSTLLIPGATSMLREMAGEEPEQMFWDSVVAAREQALTSQRTVELLFDKEKRQLSWSDGASSQRKELPPGVTVQFLQTLAGSSILLGGQLVETQEKPALRFYADGTCDAVRVQLLRPGAPPQTLAIDAWTCAPVLGQRK